MNFSSCSRVTQYAWLWVEVDTERNRERNEGICLDACGCHLKTYRMCLSNKAFARKWRYRAHPLAEMESTIVTTGTWVAPLLFHANTAFEKVELVIFSRNI